MPVIGTTIWSGGDSSASSYLLFPRHTPLHLPVIRRAIDAASFFGSDSEQLAADVADKSGTGGNASPITARAPAPNNAKVSKVDSVPQVRTPVEGLARFKNIKGQRTVNVD